MYAIFVDGGRQYKVTEGQELDLDYRDVTSGQELTFERVVAISDGDGIKLGEPLVGGASVTAEVLGPVQGEIPPPQELSPQDRPPPTLYQSADQQDRGLSDGKADLWDGLSGM
jgi:hypothetical protein